MGLTNVALGLVSHGRAAQDSQLSPECTVRAAAHSPSHDATLQVVDLDEFSKSARIVVVGCFGVPKSLQ